MSNELLTHEKQNLALVRERRCAVMVTYYPDLEVKRRILNCLPQIDQLIIVDNTPEAEPELLEIASVSPQLHIVSNRSNLGIAEALNQGIRLASDWGYKWVLTLDQDSEVAEGLLESLLAVASSGLANIGVIGANYRDIRSGRSLADDGEVGEYEERTTVITSGSLINVEQFEKVGGFRADYFIDQVDHEYCLRIRRFGAKVLLSKKILMEHCVGEAGGVHVPIIGALPEHSALRRYYMARNSVVTIKEFLFDEPSWSVRRAIRLLGGGVVIALFDCARVEKTAAFCQGIVDGLRGRMGKFDGESVHVFSSTSSR